MFQIFEMLEIHTDADVIAECHLHIAEVIKTSVIKIPGGAQAFKWVQVKVLPHMQSKS